MLSLAHGFSSQCPCEQLWIPAEAESGPLGACGVSHKLSLSCRVYSGATSAELSKLLDWMESISVNSRMSALPGHEVRIRAVETSRILCGGGGLDSRAF